MNSNVARGGPPRVTTYDMLAGRGDQFMCTLDPVIPFSAAKSHKLAIGRPKLRPCEAPSLASFCCWLIVL